MQKAPLAGMMVVVVGGGLGWGVFVFNYGVVMNLRYLRMEFHFSLITPVELVGYMPENVQNI